MLPSPGQRPRLLQRGPEDRVREQRDAGKFAEEAPGHPGQRHIQEGRPADCEGSLGSVVSVQRQEVGVRQDGVRERQEVLRHRLPLLLQAEPGSAGQEDRHLLPGDLCHLLLLEDSQQAAGERAEPHKGAEEQPDHLPAQPGRHRGPAGVGGHLLQALEVFQHPRLDYNKIFDLDLVFYLVSMFLNVF